MKEAGTTYTGIHGPRQKQGSLVPHNSAVRRAPVGAFLWGGCAYIHVCACTHADSSSDGAKAGACGQCEGGCGRQERVPSAAHGLVR